MSASVCDALIGVIDGQSPAGPSRKEVFLGHEDIDLRTRAATERKALQQGRSFLSGRLFSVELSMSRSPHGGGNPHPARRCRVRMSSSNLQDADSARSLAVTIRRSAVTVDRLATAASLWNVVRRGESSVTALTLRNC